MEQGPSHEANNFYWEIARHLWKQKVHRRVHNSPSLVAILSQIYPLHDFLQYLAYVRFNIILPSTLRPSKLSLSFRFPYQNAACIYFLPHTWLMLSAARLPSDGNPNGDLRQHSGHLDLNCKLTLSHTSVCCTSDRCINRNHS